MFYKRSTFTHYLYSAIGKLSPFVCFHNRSAAGAPHFAYTLPDQSGKVRYDVPLHTSARRKSSPPLWTCSFLQETNSSPQTAPDVCTHSRIFGRGLSTTKGRRAKGERFVHRASPAIQCADLNHSPDLGDWCAPLHRIICSGYNSGHMGTLRYATENPRAMAGLLWLRGGISL